MVNDILIVGTAWIGDMVMAEPLFRLLKQQFPDKNIHVLAPKWTQALLERMPAVGKAIPLPFQHGEFKFWKRIQLGRALAKQYERAYVLPNSWKSALIPWAAGISKRIGWLGEQRFGLLNDYRRLDEKRYPLMVQRFAALAFEANELPLAKELLYPKLEVNQEQARALALKWNIDPDKPVLALCPGAAFGPAKRWPAIYFASVARKMHAEGWQVLLLGSTSEEDIARTIQIESHKSCINTIGQTELAESIDLLSLADTVLCNDSGLMHVACALNKKVIAIYGSSSPSFTPPLGDKVTILSLNLACSPCFQRTCPLGHTRCLRDLTPEVVLKTLTEDKA